MSPNQVWASEAVRRPRMNGRVRERIRSAKDRPACSYCRSTIETAEGVVCFLCSSRMHSDCQRELGSCPTIGCEGEFSTSKSGAKSHVHRAAEEEPATREAARDRATGTSSRVLLRATGVVLLLLSCPFLLAVLAWLVELAEGAIGFEDVPEFVVCVVAGAALSLTGIVLARAKGTSRCPDPPK